MDVELAVDSRKVVTKRMLTDAERGCDDLVRRAPMADYGGDDLLLGRG